MTSVRRRLLLPLLVRLQEELVKAILQIAEGLAEQVIPWEVDPGLETSIRARRGLPALNTWPASW